MIAMEAIENPPVEMLEYTEERMKNFSKFYFHEDDKQTTEFLLGFRKQWRPNVVPMWKDEGFSPKTEIDEEVKEDAKFRHLMVLRSQFERMKRLALGLSPPRVFRPDSHPVPMRKDDSPDWINALVLIYEEEEEEGHSDPEERRNQEEFGRET